MKYLLLVLPLTCAATLLSGCPDAKLPTPSPLVPKPKANAAALQHLSDCLALNQHLAATPVSS